MTDTEALLKASVRERRRIFLAFTILLALISATLGVGWISAWGGREAWYDQAMTWQERYVELYDEFTATTGEEPDAPDPELVADEGPQGQQGAPGPVGPTGPAGRDGKDGLDSLIPGPPGASGPDGLPSTVPGPQGATGPAGRDGQDSTVPGPQGPTGADGRGIQSLYCGDTDGRWLITYTDGTSADAGPCVTPLIEGDTP